MTNNLTKDFEKLKEQKMPMFEINLKDYGLTEEDEYVYDNVVGKYDKNLNLVSLQMEHYHAIVEIDKYFSLDEHLNELLEKFVVEVIKDKNLEFNSFNDL